MSARFRLLTAFNESDLGRHAGSRTRIFGAAALARFPSSKLSDRLFRAVAELGVLRAKEVTEAFEFFAVARKSVRADVVADLCCGHGLVGMLFAAFHENVRSVWLVDREKPASFDRLVEGVASVVPVVRDKVRFVAAKVDAMGAELPRGAGVVAVHACGTLTDGCLDVAARIAGPVVVLPCCRAQAHNPAPAGLRRALGDDVAYDVHRTYELERHGYRVRWDEIPAVITPMNRILSATRRVPAPHPR